MAGLSRPHRVRRYRFTNQILREIKTYQETDNWHAPLETIEHWAHIALWIWLSHWAWQSLTVLPASVVYALAVFFIGGRQRALAGLLHQASHGALMRSKTAARIVATVLSGYPVLQSYSGYRGSHVLKHHRWLGDADIDPDYQHYQQSGLCGDNLGPRALRRFLRTLAGPRATLLYVAYLVRERIWSSDEDTRERWLRLTYLACLAVAVVALGWGPGVLLYWIVPLATTQAWIGSLAEMLEHYPLIEVAPRVDICMSRNRQYGRLMTFLLSEKDGEKYHLVHHLFPRVPLWRARDAHSTLMKDPVYASLNRPNGFFLGFRSIFAPPPPISSLNLGNLTRSSAIEPGGVLSEAAVARVQT